MKTPAWGFPLLLGGETISVLGSALSGYAISIYAFQLTRSVTTYSLISLAAIVPGLLVSTHAGQVVDRLPRRRVMLVANLGSAVLTACAAALSLSGHLALWHIAVLSALNGVAATFHVVAFEAATTLLVPREQLARASGASQTGLALAHLLAPAAAGALAGVVPLSGMLALDAASFAVAVIAVVLTPMAEPTVPGAAHDEALNLFGLRYVWARPGLLGTLLFQSAVNFALGMATVLLLPLVLSIATPVAFGAVMSSAGLGMLAAGVGLSAWGGPRKRVLVLWAGGLLMGAALAVTALIHSVPGLAVASFAAGLAAPLVNSAIQVIWQTKVPAEVQGRVFSARQLLVGAMLPLALALAGPLSDGVFEPAMREGGTLGVLLGPVVGVGTGRGVALLLSVVGALMLGLTSWTIANRHVREVELELPDAPLALGTVGSP